MNMMNRHQQPFGITGGYQRTPGQAGPPMAAFGRNGDTMMAHVTPEEASMLKARGGAGTTNPTTGLPEYYSTSNYDDRGFGAGGEGDRLSEARDTARGGGFDDRGFGHEGESARLREARGDMRDFAGQITRDGRSPTSEEVDFAMGPGTSSGFAGFNRTMNMVGPGLSGFGLQARPAVDPTTGLLSGQVTIAGMALPGFGFEGGQGAVSSGEGGGTGNEEKDRLGTELLRAVLGKSSTKPVEPAVRSPTATPYQGDPLTYGQPGSTPHRFFG